MIEEIRYIANLQRQEEFDNEVTELKDELKRLEQECDEFKKTCKKCELFDIEKTNRDLLERIDKLKQENKELKEKAPMKLIVKNNNYRSALEEIRNIADKFNYWDSNLSMASEIIGEVKDKINEVLQ